MGGNARALDLKKVDADDKLSHNNSKSSNPRLSNLMVTDALDVNLSNGSKNGSQVKTAQPKDLVIVETENEQLNN